MKAKRRRTKKVRSVWEAFASDEREPHRKDHDEARREQTAAASNTAAHGCSRIRPLYEVEDYSA